MGLFVKRINVSGYDKSKRFYVASAGWFPLQGFQAFPAVLSQYADHIREYLSGCDSWKVVFYKKLYSTEFDTAYTYLFERIYIDSAFIVEE